MTDELNTCETRSFRRRLRQLTGTYGTRIQPALRVVVTVLCALGAVVLAVFSAYYFRPASIVEWPQAVHFVPPQIKYSDEILSLPPYGQELEIPIVLLAASAVLAKVAMVFSRHAPTLPRISRRPLISDRLTRLHWYALLLGAICLWVLAEVNGLWLELDALKSMKSHWQFGLLVAGCSLVTWGLGSGGMPATIPMGWGKSTPRRSPHSGSPRWLNTFLPERALLLIVASMTLGLALRLWHLDNALRFFVDEMNFTNALRYFWLEDDIPLLQPISNTIAMPRLYPYLQNNAIPLAGHSLIAIRLPSLLFGTLTIPAAYLLGKHLFDRQTGSLAAFLLAVYPVHIHFSRLGLNNIADPLFGTLGFAFFAKGLRSRRKIDYALAGTMLGLTQYFYEGGRLLFPPLTLAWIAGGFILWRPRPAWRGVVITLIAAMLVAAPVYYTLVASDRPLTARLEIMSYRDNYWQNLLTPSAEQPAFLRQHADQIIEAMMIFVHQTEEGFYYGGQTPLLLISFAPLVLLGLAFSAGRWHQPGPLLLFLWLLATAAGNSLIRGRTEAPRNVILFPALVLLAAVGLRHALKIVSFDRCVPRTRIRWSSLALGIILVVLAVSQISYYFGPHLDLFNRQLRYARAYPDGQDAMMRAIDFPANTQVHLISTWLFDERFANDVAKFFTSKPIPAVTRAPSDITPEYLDALPTDVDHAFFLEPNDAETLALLSDYFTLEPPQVTSHPHVPPDRAFVLYYAPHAPAGTGDN